MKTPAYLAVALAALVLAGCAAAPPPAATPTAAASTDAPSTDAPSTDAPTPTQLTEAELLAMAAEADRRARDNLTSSFPDAVVPDVTREHFIALADYGKVMAQCMQDQGFDVTATSDGGWGGYIAEGDQEAHAIGTYSCAIRFPVNPIYDIPLNESQLTYLYDYVTGDLTDCLERNGFTVQTPPSLENYIGSGGAWTPYSDEIVSASLWPSLEKQCPQIPPALYGSSDDATG